MKKQKFQTTTLSKLLALTMLGTLLIPAVSGNQTSHTHTVSAETSPTNESVVQITSDTEILTSSTNLLTGNNTTFETGVGDWTAFGGGTIQSAANPDGDGNVLKFSSPSHTWDTPAIDIKNFIQSNATKEAYVKVVMSIYSPSDVTTTMKIRVAETDDLSIAANAELTHPKIGGETVSAGKWTEVVGEFTVTESDLANDASYWRLCLDGLSNYTDTLYLDNVQIYIDEGEVVLPTPNEITRGDYMKIGAIRWDAYTETTADGMDVASQVARILTPSQYHWQVPFFANIDEEGTVSFPEYTVETWEKEAEYATNAGIDYFAYLWYDTDDAMSQARKAHLQSDKKDTIEMCAILETIRTHSTMQELYAAMQEDYYLKVEGMPVVFLYTQDDWTAEEVLKLRQDAVRAGVDQALYIVGMISGTYVLEGTYDKGLDALSWYGTGSLSTGITYQELAQRCDDTISRVSTSVRNNGIHMVPNFTTGMDTRARIQTGASWISGDPNAENDTDKPYMNRYALSGTAEEIAAYAGTVLEWTAENEDVTETNLVLTYAWNEHDEGGWLCPTLKVDDDGNVIYDESGNPEINTERLAELEKVIDTYRATESGIVESDDINLVGHQISATLTDTNGNIGGIRAVGSIEPTVNGQNVNKWGFVYALNEAGGTVFDVSESDMYVGSENAYVQYYETTEDGILNTVMGESTTATYFVRTMTFGGSTAEALSADYSIRVYAELEDGTYVYSNVKSYSIYRVSDVLYQRNIMSSYSRHTFLYDNVLSVVNPDYVKVEYNWSNAFVK